MKISVSGAALISAVIVGFGYAASYAFSRATMWAWNNTLALVPYIPTIDMFTAFFVFIGPIMFIAILAAFPRD